MKAGMHPARFIPAVLYGCRGAVDSERVRLQPGNAERGFRQILVEADDGLTAFRLGQMQAIRNALPGLAQRLRCGGSIF
jgi:hypothetical protein